MKYKIASFINSDNPGNSFIQDLVRSNPAVQAGLVRSYNNRHAAYDVQTYDPDQYILYCINYDAP